MFAIQALPTDFLSGHLRRRRPTSLQAKASRTSCEEYQAQPSSAHGALFVHSFAQERTPTPLFSGARAIFTPARLLQLPYSQSLTDSLTLQKSITSSFTVTS